MGMLVAQGHLARQHRPGSCCACEIAVGVQVHCNCLYVVNRMWYSCYVEFALGFFLRMVFGELDLRGPGRCSAVRSVVLFTDSVLLRGPAEDSFNLNGRNKVASFLPYLTLYVVI